jgi:hypothetical protein
LTELTAAQQLNIISKAWGRQKGYCFFPWIAGNATTKEERIKSYHEGRAYLWPAERADIVAHLEAHTNDDLYWCPSLFEKKRRQLDFAMDEHSLWADLDEVDPRSIEDYPPTVAWETSPGRYQALWLITAGDMQGASWAGGENHRLTYHIGADPSGWDTTQLLRLPGWGNHKPEYRHDNGDGPPKGRLLWSNGRRYLPDEFDELPEISGLGQINDVLDGEVENVDRLEVWGRVRLKVTKRCRDLVAAREVAGDRSDALWEIERDLADAGCTTLEIVAIVRGTVWNKFAGRADELRRLTTEAAKAIAARPPEVEKKLEEDAEEKPQPTQIDDLLQGVKPPKWLIENIWAQGSCGFIAGQPKSFKSWTALDMVLSIATGTDFLGSYRVARPGPVLYIQEEDPAPTVKQRYDKVWPSKLADRMKFIDGVMTWIPALEIERRPPVMVTVGAGFTISDLGWQAWLDEVLEKGYDGERYVAVVMDPLMMIMGDVDDHRAGQMTDQVFKPIKQLSRKHNVAVIIVHHMRKSDPSKPQRGGQLMLGSVANHAWTEDSIYLRIGTGGDVIAEVESKHAPSGSFKITRLRNKKWTPVVIEDKTQEDQEHEEEVRQARRSTKSKWGGDTSKHRTPALPKDGGTGRRPAGSKVVAVMTGLGESDWHTVTDIATATGVSRESTRRQLDRAHTGGLLLKNTKGQYRVKVRSEA